MVFYTYGNYFITPTIDIVSGSADSYYTHQNTNGTTDPFDAEWAAIASRNGQAPRNGPTPRSTNPFLSNGNSPAPTAIKAFEVHM